MNQKLINKILRNIPPNRQIQSKRDWNIINKDNGNMEILIETITPQNVKETLKISIDKKEINNNEC